MLYSRAHEYQPIRNDICIAHENETWLVISQSLGNFEILLKTTFNISGFLLRVNV